MVVDVIITTRNKNEYLHLVFEPPYADELHKIRTPVIIL